MLDAEGSSPVSKEEIRNILVVEDEPSVLNLLASEIKSAFDSSVKIFKSESISEAKQVLQKESIDLALLDINLPDGQALKLLPIYAAAPFNTRCIMLTASDDDELIFQSLRMGASGYLLKNEPVDQLVGKLTGIVNGVPPLSSSVSRKILAFFNKPSETQEGVVLTKREESVLTLLAQGKSRSEIAEELALSPHTISGYIKIIYQKLNVTSRVEATHAAIKLGLS